MATSGQVKTNIAYDSYFWVSWSQKGNQDIANNQTKIDWSCGVYCGHSFYSNAIKMSAVTINGSKVYEGGTYSNFSKGNHTIASGTLTITHNSDGSKSFSISPFTGWLYSNYNYSSDGKSYDLNTIPRISKPTLSVSSLDFGKSVTIYTNRKSTSFTHKLWYKYGNSGWVAITSDASVTDSYAWTVPLTLMNQIPNASSLDITVSCDTYYNNTYIGEEHVSIKASVPDTTAYYPSIKGIDWVKSSNEPSNWPMTQGVSQGTMTMTGVSGVYGSTIKSYSLTFDGLSSNAASLVVNNISSHGNVKAVAKVTDSRGRTTTKEIVFLVYEYSKPLLGITIYRSGAGGVEDPYGDYIYVKVDAGVYAIADNDVTSLTLQYKQRSAFSYTTVSLRPNISSLIPASSDYTWDWIVSASDKVASVSLNGSVATGDVVLDILANGKGIGFGKVAEKEGLTGSWDLELPNIKATNKLDSTTLLVGGVDVSSIKNMKDFVVEQGTSGIWTYRKWNSGIAECWGEGKFTINGWNTWGALYESTNTFQATYPTNLFNATPIATITVSRTDPNNNIGTCGLEIFSGASKTQTPVCYALRPGTGATGDIYLSLVARGRWK